MSALQQGDRQVVYDLYIVLLVVNVGSQAKHLLVASAQLLATPMHRTGLLLCNVLRCFASVILMRITFIRITPTSCRMHVSAAACSALLHTNMH